MPRKVSPWTTTCLKGVGEAPISNVAATVGTGVGRSRVTVAVGQGAREAVGPAGR
jgi:hypothetical protein